MKCAHLVFKVKKKVIDLHMIEAVLLVFIKKIQHVKNDTTNSALPLNELIFYE